MGLGFQGELVYKNADSPNGFNGSMIASPPASFPPDHSRKTVLYRAHSAR